MALSEEYDRVSDLALHDDLLFAAVNSSDPSHGQLVVGNVTTGETVSNIVWPNKTVPSLTVYNETVLVGGAGGGSNAYSIPDRDVVAPEERFGFGFDYRFSVYEDIIYDTPGQIRARNIKTGKLLFEKELQATAQHQPLRQDGRIHVMSRSGVRALDAITGEEQWSVRTDSPVLSPPVFGDRIAIFTDNSNVIYAVDIETGELLHEADPFEFSLGDIELIDGTLFAIINGFRALEVQTE